MWVGWPDGFLGLGRDCGLPAECVGQGRRESSLLESASGALRPFPPGTHSLHLFFLFFTHPTRHLLEIKECLV